MSSTLSGRCLCGAVRYACAGPPNLVVTCHCAMCRRAGGAPSVTWAAFPRAAVTIQGEPVHRRSSERAVRSFCGACGSQLFFAYDHQPEEIDVTVGTLDDPALAPPACHLWTAEQIPWHAVADGLPRFPEQPDRGDRVPPRSRGPVRTAKASDVEAITSLLGVQLGEHGVELAPGALRDAVLGLVGNRARGLVLVAENDGAVVGIACVSFIWTLEHGGASAWLDELFVTPAQREKGVGAALLEAVLDRARALGHAAIDLEIESGHERVESLYRRFGFEPHRRSRWVKRLER